MAEPMVHTRCSTPSVPHPILTRARTIAWACVFAAVFSQPVQSQSILSAEDISDAMSLLEEIAERENHVGYEVAVSLNGEVILNEARGMASLEYDVPVSPDTRFIIMSVTKAFTGTAAYLALRDGFIELDAPVSAYLSEAPFDMPPSLTIRTLLTHTAGAPHFNHPGRRAFYTQHYDDAVSALAVMVVFPEEGLSVAIVENSWVTNARVNNLVRTGLAGFAERVLELARP